MSLEKCETINLANVSTIVRKNMAIHVSFLNPYYDVSFLVGNHTYMDHMITIRKINSRTKRVSFLNVPHFICEQEVFHLLAFFGKVHEKKIIKDLHKDGLLKGFPNRNQHVKVELDEGASIPSYFWFEGPSHEMEHPLRIQIKHQGQINQCYNCLNVGDECMGGGNGKLCRSRGGDKTHLEDYNNKLFSEIGYQSLKRMSVTQVRELAKKTGKGKTRRLKSCLCVDTTPPCRRV